MEASDLLAAITVEPLENPHQEVCFQEGDRQLPITGIRLEHDKLVLFVTEGSPPMSMNEFVLQLMLHRKAHVFVEHNEQPLPVYGFREEHEKLIL